MNKTKNAVLGAALLAVAGGLLWTSLSSNAQEVPAEKVANEKTTKTMQGQIPVAEFPLNQNGLYYAGKKGTDYAFGPRITPHGNCITAIPGYVFVGWYRAPRSDRHLMISRLDLATKKWTHVELPERNTTGHNYSCPGNPDGCGESHRTAAVGVCPLDGTIHLMFDMHANDLQYIVSKPGAATAPDSEFTAAQFNPKQNGLIAGKKLDARVTYPGFLRNEKGEIFAGWREGGTSNGNMVSATYDGKKWSQPYMTWRGSYGKTPKDSPLNRSIYGDQKYLNGKMYAGFSIRTASTPIELNQGLYFAEGGQKLSDDLVDLKGIAHETPIKDYTPFMIDEPVPNNDYRMSSGPSWTVSERGDVHMIVDFSTNKPAQEYIRPAGVKEFIKTINPNAPGGALYAVGDRIFAFGQSKGQLTISSTPAGKSEWKKFPVAKTPDLLFGNSTLQDGVLYYFAMQDIKDPQSQPLTLLALDLKNVK